MTIDEAKAQARALRAALSEQGTAISHAQALELVARQHGARDWNTLHARLALGNAPPELAVGDQVRGRYLGQGFSGTVIGLSGPASHRQIEIRFDQPVDVVRFESFSNLRRQIRAVIDEHGRSHRHTSDGQPQLVVELAGA
ncbi:glyoxalase superfamily protein [Paracoccus sp. CPCC 101403]|uniref:Glyoxalase superfamily protein n=2 Tax=Paracoccus broussonetiae TaxID=3075834 RepID=A0ABU3EDQ1_9RHOB|nr:glyoxalase superfamily protein [Paracoccus sp. CPCC 101403]MDT1062358.1 glyoxalase superfamily protein [Paracoccus sp. CPCC 101403]